MQFQTSYTWSKAMDVGQSQLGSAEDPPPPDPMNLRLEKGPMRSDTPHNLRFNAIYRLPEFTQKGGAVATLMNGWWISGILSLQTGYPFNPLVSANRSRSKATIGTQASNSDRPDLAPGRHNSNIVSGTTAGCAGVTAGRKLGTPDLYYDPCAFTLQQAGFLGTAGRNILRGPGLANLDFSIVKDSAVKFLGEGGKVEFRTEFFNVLNRPNFASKPATSVFAGNRDDDPRLATAGLISNTATTARQIQFALKVLF